MDKNQPLTEINIIDTQTDTLHQPQTATIEKFCHEGVFAGYCTKHLLNFALCQDCGWCLVTLTAYRGKLTSQRFVKDISI